MANLCDGIDTNAQKILKNSKAYCEGVNARFREVTPTNPHAASSEANAAFTAGVDDAAADTIAGCCAKPGGALPT